MTFFCTDYGKNVDESLFCRNLNNKCKGCLNKIIKRELCGKFMSEKCLTIEREHQPNETKPKIDNVNNKIVLPERQKLDNNNRVSAHD